MVRVGVKDIRQGARLWLTLFAMLAFAFQSYAVQTHFHKLSFAGAVALGDKSSPAHQKAPAPLDHACPLCQAVAHGGVFVMPGAVAALLPTLSVQIIAGEIVSRLVFQPVSHGWQSRAPPLS